MIPYICLFTFIDINSFLYWYSTIGKCYNFQTDSYYVSNETQTVEPFIFKTETWEIVKNDFPGE